MNDPWKVLWSRCFGAITDYQLSFSPDVSHAPFSIRNFRFIRLLLYVLTFNTNAWFGSISSYHRNDPNKGLDSLDKLGFIQIRPHLSWTPQQQPPHITPLINLFGTHIFESIFLFWMLHFINILVNLWHNSCVCYYCGGCEVDLYVLTCADAPNGKIKKLSLNLRHQWEGQGHQDIPVRVQATRTSMRGSRLPWNPC